MASLPPIKVPIVGVDKYTKSFNKLTSKVKKLGTSITSVGKTMTASLTVPILGVGVAGLKMSKDFNKAMANVGTLIPGQRERLQGFKKDVLDLGAATGVSSNIIAEGLYETISAFGDAEDPIKKLDIATKMSVAGLSTVKESLSLVSAVTKGYGDTSDAAAQRVSDLSFLTVKLGQTTFPELAASMGKVVPLATTLGVKQEELFGGFATLTGVTGNASEVATQLTSALGSFITPSEAMTKAAKKLGYESSVAMVQELGLGKSLQELGELTGGSAIKMGKLITRKEGLNAALTLLGPQAKNFAEKTHAMGSAAGSTAAAFEEQQNGINKAGASYDKMVESLKAVAIQIGDKLAPILLSLLQRIQPVVDSLMGMSDASWETGLKVAGLVAAIGPAIMIVGKLTVAASTVMSVIGGAGGLGVVLAALTGPVGIAVAAVAGFTAAVIYLWDEIKPIRDALQTSFMDTFNDIKDVMTSSGHSANGLGQGIKSLASMLSRLVAPAVKVASKLALMPLRMIVRWVRIGVEIFGKFGQVFSIIGKAVTLATVYLDNLWESFTTGTVIGQTVAAVFEAIGEAINYVGEAIASVWGSITGFFEGVADELSVVGIKLDKAVEKQKAESIKKTDVAGDENYGLDQSVLNTINQGKTEANFSLVIEGMPNTKARVVSEDGGKLNVKTKGQIMEPAGI